ncbi:MAG TPA: glycine cleavage T C-terminal barrel domain-containing protein, partial [Rubellimicrobium sp.]|nr:glycine cleavage T C-terminal barrel domain-containing protein [Rubellimicrobium sp.]
KPEGFIGREALLRQRDAGPLRRRLVQLQLPDLGPETPMLHHNEPILRDGLIVGSVTSGAWGHRIGASLGMGYVAAPEGINDSWLSSGTWEVEVAWRRVPVRVQRQPWYDPKGLRLKGLAEGTGQHQQEGEQHGHRTTEPV